MKWIAKLISPSFTTVMPKTGNRYPLAIFLSAALAPTSDALETRFDNHDLSADFRPRAAYVSADENGRALSALFRVNLESEWHSKIRSLIQVDHVELGWEDQFSNGVNLTNKPVIPDNSGTELNQGFVDVDVSNTLSVRAGREAINLGNERFIGTNSFWQNEQTYDGGGFRYTFASASELEYRYISNTNRIFGSDAGRTLQGSESNNPSPALRPARFLGDHEQDSHLLFASIREWDFSQLQLYYLDIDNRDVSGLSNETVGIRYQFKGRYRSFRTEAHGEFARQKRTEISESYLNYNTVGMTVGFGKHQLGASRESLGSNGDISLTTPLASLHDHNGWADQFLITPNDGLVDNRIQYFWRKNPIKVDARYHHFQTVKNRQTLADELDIDLIYKFNKNSTLLIRFADFQSKSPNYRDEQRVFLQFNYHLNP